MGTTHKRRPHFLDMNYLSSFRSGLHGCAGLGQLRSTHCSRSTCGAAICLDGTLGCCRWVGRLGGGGLFTRPAPGASNCENKRHQRDRFLHY